MNTLSPARRAAVVRALVEGTSVRGTTRLVGCDKDTVLRILEEVGTFCSIYQDHVLVNLPCERLEADEIWSYCGAKQKNARRDGQGDLWTHVMLCSTTKLAVSWVVGSRTPQNAELLLRDSQRRLTRRVQLTTDGHRFYPPAVDRVFGVDVDYAQLAKQYRSPGSREDQKRYSPPICIGCVKQALVGNPDMALVSTSYVERANLTMRMQMRRFTRLTNAFSKKAENHAHAVSLHFMYYNFCRPHQTLTKEAGAKTTPAMAAGITDRIWTVESILGLMDPQKLLQ